MKNFFELVKDAETTIVKRGGGGKSNTHNGAYINAQGRLFGATDKYNTYFDVVKGKLKDGTVFIGLTPAVPTKTTDKNGKTKEDYGKALKSSVESTGAPFITVTRLCRELFGDEKADWEHEFEDQGVDENGTHYFTLIDEAETDGEQEETESSDDAETEEETKE